MTAPNPTGDPVPWDEYAWVATQHDVPAAPVLEVTDNPVLGRLYGPAGDLVSVVRARATVPFGPQPTGDTR